MIRDADEHRDSGPTIAIRSTNALSDQAPDGPPKPDA